MATKRRKKGKRKGAKGALAAAALFLLAKLKYAVAILKLTKLATLLSLFVSLWIYAVFFGWKFAVALMYNMIIHESGHLIAAKQRHVKTTPMFFIPFVGAAIGMKEPPKHARDESYIAFGGPFLGAVATLVALLLYLWTHEPLWGLAVYIGAMLNLFNLIPITPLDGGRMITAISPKLWIMGLVILGIAAWFIPGPIIFLIFVLGIIELMTHFREPYRYRLNQVFLTMLKRRKKTILAFNECEDVYEKNQKTFIDQKRRESIDDRLNRLRANKQLPRRFRRLRTYVFEIEREVLRHTWLDETDNSIGWLDHMIEAKEKEMAQMSQYFKTSRKEKWIAGLAYIGLVLVLGLFFYFGESVLPNPDTLMK